MKENPLNVLVGKQLSSVEFVQDYIQFHFDGPVLSAITDPVVTVKGTTYERNSTGFCEQLIKCITQIVKKAIVEENIALRLELDDYAILSISLRPEDYITAEAAILYTGPDEGMSIW